MSLEAMWAEIEEDQTWRQDEIRFLQNQIALLDTEDQRIRFRRALVLLLYAHYEGFCKFAFSLYVRGVNDSGITCGEAHCAIAAASLSEVFKGLRNPDHKCREFNRTAPDDRKLHAFAREREFIERATEFDQRPVSLPDAIVDTESNLKPVVLRKNLYRLGFAHDQFETMEPHISELLEHRNGIAHGRLRAGISPELYERVRDAVFTVMNEVKREVMTALDQGRYRRSA